jgi:hypothetical protein
MTTPNLTEVITAGIERMLSNVHTAMPGIVESYDSGKNTAAVKPALKRKYVDDGTAVELPIISVVPVLFPRTANAHLALPVAKGDYVLLVFSERGIARWLDKGGVVDPEEPVMFALNDAVAIPGIYPLASAPARNGSDDSVELANKTSYVEIKDSGEILIKSGTLEFAIGSGEVRIKAAKIVLESADVNLGDESGEALVKKSDLNTLTVIGVQPGAATIPVTNTAVGTIKTKAS